MTTPVVRVLGRISGGLHRLEDGLLVASLLTILALALVQIVLRNGFDAGLTWADPFGRILILWVTMLGAMCATRENNHIAIDAMARYLPPRWSRLVEMATALASAVICALAARYTGEFMLIEREDETIAFANVPVWICQSILPFGFGVMAVRFVLQPFVNPAATPASPV